MNAGKSRKPGSRVVAAGALALAVSAALAQELPPPPVFPPAPQQQPAPIQAPPPVFQAPTPGVPAPAPEFAPQFAPQFTQPVASDQAPGKILKQMFATTVATMTQTLGGTVLTSLTQAITGGITNWFNRRKAKAEAAAQAQAQVQLQAPAPVQAFAPAPLPPAPQFFDAQTGAPAAPDPVFAQALAAPDPGGIFAGLAFEVHAVLPGGATAAVNPATHEFRTGDRFVVHYRPTLPGQMTVFNINPAGIQTQIERVDLAAGQLAQLGPYEFAAMTGDEQLRLVLSPCQTPALLATTRDIINVSSTTAEPAAFNLAACSPVTRSIRDVPTRDIRKVALDDTTAFALDPVSAGEFSSGQVQPREVTITFRHR